LFVRALEEDRKEGEGGLEQEEEDLR